MKEKFNEKVIPVILKFINTKGIQSIKNGMVTSMSPLIIGSIFLILSNFPVKAVVDVLESTGIKAVLDQACGATFSISAMIAVIGISYSYAKLENQNLKIIKAGQETEMDEKFELACFQIITYVGTARTHFINAIHCAKEGKYDEAAELIKQGDEAFSLGHNAHADLLTMDANGEISNGYMLLMHAEDQLMSAESFRTLADEFIALYKRIDEK